MGAVRRQGTVWEAAMRTALLAREDLGRLRGRRIVITGSTGLVCSHLVRTLLLANDEWHLGMKLLLPLRDPSRAEAMFGKERGDIDLVPWRLGDEVDVPGGFDCLVHGACPTASREFVERPAEVLLGIVDGAAACLESSEEEGCSVFVYLSSMEVYGRNVPKPAGEENVGSHDPSSMRNSYPIGKLAAESLVRSYGLQRDMRTVSLRLAQTFGAGVGAGDGRAFAEFARCALSGGDIVLATEGSKRNCYTSLVDTSAAILRVLANPSAEGPYNVANPDTYCSVREMAEWVMLRFGTGDGRVVVAGDATAARKYPPSTDLLLDVSRMKGLGWRPTEGLEEMYEQMVGGWDDERRG